jgi:hypothetical protein
MQVSLSPKKRAVGGQLTSAPLLERRARVIEVTARYLGIAFARRNGVPGYCFWRPYLNTKEWLYSILMGKTLGGSPAAEISFYPSLRSLLLARRKPSPLTNGARRFLIIRI